jgi:signal peptide peptidase SppA
MVDKNYLVKTMKDLPGVPGAVESDESLPGVPMDDRYDSGYKEGFLKGYEKGLDDSDDSDEDKDCDEDMKVSKGMKTSKSKSKFMASVYSAVKSMFSGNSFVSNGFSPLYSVSNGVGIIKIYGMINKRPSAQDISNGMVDVDEITKCLKIAAKDDTVATVLCFDCPGGNSVGIQECGDVIKELTTIKPVFAFTDKLCASAAYWLASCTNGIYCTSSSELGCIGVIAKLVDISEHLEMNGVKVRYFTGGELKAMGAPEKPLTDKEESFIQAEIDEQTIKFKNTVNANRGGVSDDCMQGQLFNGDKAVEMNIADEVVPELDTLLTLITT